ncbi:MAG: GDSL-type esterase/lipase family protein [Hyphomicrobiales bacterium]
MKVRNILGSAILFLVALGVSLLAGEFILRLQNSSMKNYNIEMWRYAKELKTPSAVPELGHEHLRNTSAVLQSVDIRLNEYGLRGGPLEPLPPGGRRILFLGGSITLGWGVPEEETVTARLQQQFATDGQQVQVLNAGIGNYNALRYTENFFRNLEDLKPTDIVVEYFLRDAEQLDSGGGNILLRNSELAVTVWAAIQNVLGPKGETALVDHYNAVYDPASEGFKTMRAQLKKLADYARQNNIRIYLAMMPDVHNLTNYPFLKIHQQMEQIAKEDGYTYVDLLPGFLDLKPEDIWAMPGDPHPNGLGHKIMADQLYPILRLQP